MDEAHGEKTSTRRTVLKASGAVLLLGAVGGASTQLDNGPETGQGQGQGPEPGTGPANSTNTETENQTTEEPVQQRTGFSQIYSQTYDSTNHLTGSDLEEVQEIAENQSISAALERGNEIMDGLLRHANRDMKEFVHNDLEYTSDEVRVLERTFSSGDPYAAVMVNEGDAENPEWIKDLQSFTGNEAGYLRHDETSLDNSGERGLQDLWDQSDGADSVSSYSAIKEAILSFGTREETSEEEWEETSEVWSERNDHIVVDDVEDEGEVCYTQSAAQTLEGVMDFDANDLFNREMELVENITELYHNGNQQYLQVGVTEGSLEDGQTELTSLDSGEKLYAEGVDQITYDEAVLSLYEEE